MPLSYNHILVAVDGSKEAEWAFRKAVGIAKRNDATMHLVRVIDYRSLPTTEFYDRSIMDRAEREARTLLDRYQQEANAAGAAKVNTIIETGSPKHVIPRELARRVGADLIVCGATGHGPIERFVMGSVSQQIVRSSPCDVLVVRTEEHTEANE